MTTKIVEIFNDEFNLSKMIDKIEKKLEHNYLLLNINQQDRSVVQTYQYLIRKTNKVTPFIKAQIVLKYCMKQISLTLQQNNLLSINNIFGQIFNCVCM